ncbi:hypothetical protein SLA2020_452180 [Shorea laevis]
MYVVPPPQRPDPGSGSTDLRVYQAWKGSNIFFLQGRFIFGPDVRSLGLTIFLIVAPVAVFCVFVARKLMDDFSHHLGISIMVVAVVFTVYVLVLLLLTSGRDPGIIPRNAHPPEPESFDGSVEVGAGQTPQLRLPRIKEVESDLITTAPGLGSVLGCEITDSSSCLSSRRPFFVYMSLPSAGSTLRRSWKESRQTIWKAMIKTPASIVLIVYTFISMWFVGGLTAFHLYLISTNQTTYENFRYRYDRRANPYNKGVVENFKEIFCTSISPSKNNFRATVPREPGLPARNGQETVWGDMGPGADHCEGQLNNNDRMNIKDGELGEISPDVRTTVEDPGDRAGAGMHPRRSSWGRKSGSWEMSPEVLALAARVGEPNRVGGSSSSNLTTENNRHS